MPVVAGESALTGFRRHSCCLTTPSAALESRISQFRRQLSEDWEFFMGEPACRCVEAS